MQRRAPGGRLGCVRTTTFRLPPPRLCFTCGMREDKSLPQALERVAGSPSPSKGSPRGNPTSHHSKIPDTYRIASPRGKPWCFLSAQRRVSRYGGSGFARLLSRLATLWRSHRRDKRAKGLISSSNFRRTRRILHAKRSLDTGPYAGPYTVEVVSSFFLCGGIL